MTFDEGAGGEIDKAGRVVIRATVRAKVGLTPGAELEVVVDDGSIRLVRAVPRPRLVGIGNRLVARPTANPKRLPAVDVAGLVEEGCNRWPR